MNTHVIVVLLMLIMTTSEGKKELVYRILEPTLLHATEKTLVVLIVCGIHAREYYTSKICRGFQEKHEKIRYVLVDEMNPEGIAMVLNNTENSRCWRGNARGIDLNRNFPHPYKRLKRSARMTREEENHGPYDMSEWECVSLEEIIEKVHPNVLFAVHSGDISVLIPYDGYSIANPLLSLHTRVAKRALESMCSTCRIGSSIRTLGYEAFGTLTDHAALEKNVKYVYTLETFYNSSTAIRDDDCVSRFNPSANFQQSIAQIWSEMFIPAIVKEIYFEEFIRSRSVTLRQLLFKDRNISVH